MTKTRFLGVLALGGLLLACGGGDDDGSGGPVPLDQFGARFADVACARIFECCDDTERMSVFGSFDPPVTTQAECEGAYAELFDFVVSLFQESIDAGKIAYDADAAGNCLAALDSGSCSEINSDNPFGAQACDTIFAGQVAGGQACTDDSECAGDAFCQGAMAGTPGACAARPGNGEACPDFECADAHYCKDGTCAPLEADGQACTLDGDCQSDYCEVSNDTCAPDPATLMCDGS